MAIEDYLETEVVVAVALTAAIASPTVRNLIRRGAVYAMAGLMVAGDALTTAARGATHGAQQMAATVGEMIHENGDRPAREQVNSTSRARRRPQTARRAKASAEGGGSEEHG